ncbi:hypothetical protein BaRGS_00001448 [Batillaria attramentaria]|uniref:Uncharacterized protein n=1 Tax=Batillaria attramentaria TaxID=370345 RepID=A0ABD0M8E1_9CAEN
MATVTFQNWAGIASSISEGLPAGKFLRQRALTSSIGAGRISRRTQESNAHVDQLRHENLASIAVQENVYVLLISLCWKRCSTSLSISRKANGAIAGGALQGESACFDM